MATFAEGDAVWIRIESACGSHEYKGDVMTERRGPADVEYKVRNHNTKRATWVKANEIRPRDANEDARAGRTLEEEQRQLRCTPSHMAHIAQAGTGQAEGADGETTGADEGRLPASLEVVDTLLFAMKKSQAEVILKEDVASAVNVKVVTLYKAEPNQAMGTTIEDTVVSVKAAHDALIQQVATKENITATFGKLIAMTDSLLASLPETNSLRVERNAYVFKMQSAVESFQRLTGREMEDALPDLVAEIMPMSSTLKKMNDELGAHDRLLQRQQEALEVRQTREDDLDHEMKIQARTFMQRVLSFGTQISSFNERLASGLNQLNLQLEDIKKKWAGSFMPWDDIRALHKKDIDEIDMKKAIFERHITELNKGKKKIIDMILSNKPVSLNDMGMDDLILPMRDAFMRKVVCIEGIEPTIKSAIDELVDSLENEDPETGLPETKKQKHSPAASGASSGASSSTAGASSSFDPLPGI